MTGAASRVTVLADDLIWSTRLVRALADAGATPVHVRTPAALAAALDDGCRFVVVDLTARAYDGIAAVGAAASHGARVLAVGQHDDLDLRRRARAAGAERVLAYRKLFEDGPASLAAWLSREPAAARS